MVKKKSNTKHLREAMASAPLEYHAPKKQFGARELVDFLMDIPELSEAFTRADIELAIDDQGWQGFAGTKNLADMDSVLRPQMINKARLYWLKDPLAHQAVRLWTDYSVGTGISYKAKDTKVQATIDKFMRDRRNKSITSAAGQQRSSKQLLTDGDVFFAIFKGKANAQYMRKIDPLQITDLITDPDDDERVLAYRRKTANDKVLYYADSALDAEGRALAEQQSDPVIKSKKITLEKNVVVYHRPFDNIGKRGNGLLNCILDWTREHRRFMEARVAITQALAKFAHKITAKGGQQVLNDLQTRLQSTIATSGLNSAPEKNPVGSPASTFLQNAGLNIEQMPRVTGAAEARDDSDGLKLMVSAGTNIMLHYFGDPSTGNLATATAMELPMLKSFGTYQELWISAWRDIFTIVVNGDNLDAPEPEIDIDLPPILDEDLTALGAFITQLTAAFPEVKIPEVLQMLLTALGINNIDAIMKSIEKNKVELDAQQASRDELLAKQPRLDPAQAAAQIKAQENLAEAFTKLANKL